MAVPVQQDLALAFGNRLGKAPRGRLARKEFLEQIGRRRQTLGLGTGQHRAELVAQREQAGRLQTDDGHTARDERSGGGERRGGPPPAPPRPGLPKETCARSTAARRAVDPRRQHRDAIAETRQHLDRGPQVLGLEVGVERVGEQRDFARCPLSPPLAGRGRGGANQSS